MRVNREAPTLVFKGPQNDIPKTSTTAALTAKFKPESGMEAEVAAMLKAAGVQNEQDVEDAEQALALQVPESARKLLPHVLVLDAVKHPILSLTSPWSCAALYHRTAFVQTVSIVMF